MRPDIRLSVALVTRNRPQSLDRCLRSLRRQSPQPYEVVVSDDSEGELAAQTAAVVRKHGATYVPGPRRGLYANRNFCIAQCSGTSIRTMDDDHEFPPGHLSACMAALASDSDSVWAMSEFLPGQESPHRTPPRPGELHPRGFSVLSADPLSNAGISDGASIYPRSIFDRGVRFAEYFKFGYAYLELGDRLRALGIRIRFLDSTYVIHHMDLSRRSFMDPLTDEASRVFAMLSHSFLHRRSLRNMSLTLGQLVWATLRQPLIYREALVLGYRAYRRHSDELAAHATLSGLV